MSNESGVLYVVATPIGNLDDISQRAKTVLETVDLVLAEDTRHSRKLLNHLGISTPMRAYHDHNERELAPELVAQLREGRSLALVSDAGTPLIHDPGFQLLKLCHANGIRTVPIPGACALTTALCVAGFNSERFIFEGFLPEKKTARARHLRQLAREPRTMVFYEAPHRILACLDECRDIFGAGRGACIARELSKYYETIRRGTLAELCEFLRLHEQQRKGEFVVIIEGSSEPDTGDNEDVTGLLGILLQAMPVKQAAAMAAEITGRKKNELYRIALTLQDPE